MWPLAIPENAAVRSDDVHLHRLDAAIVLAAGLRRLVNLHDGDIEVDSRGIFLPFREEKVIGFDE